MVRAKSNLDAGKNPLPVRISTLGQFSVEIDGNPLRAGTKAQRKPMELLKVLVALGGDGVSVETLCESIWPESDGDKAYNNLNTTLTRLRKLIGREVLHLQDGRLSLDSHSCRVDAREFTRLLTLASQAINAGNGKAAWEHLEGAISLYQGPFLEGEFDPPEILSAREKLHSQFVRHVKELGEFFLQNGHTGKAISLYRKGLEVDDLCEEFYQNLMDCYRRQGRLAEGIAVYQRCRQTLQARMEVEPSPGTEQAHQSLLADDKKRRSEPKVLSDSAQSGLLPPPKLHKNLESVESPSRLPEKPVIAVLPFENLGGDSDRMYFTDGMVEDIITELSRFRYFLVIARNTSFTYKGKSVDVRDVGRELGVRYVLEGSVQKAGNRVRITAQLVDAEAGNHLWAEQFDRELGDIFALQDEIAGRVAGSIQPELYSAEIQRAQRKDPGDLDVWNYAVRGQWHVWRYTKQDNREAQLLFTKALKLNPNYVPTLAFLVYTHIIDIFFGWSENVGNSIGEAFKYVKKAAELDTNDPLVQCAVGLTEFIAKQSDKAIFHFRKAIELNRSFALAYGYLCLALAYGGEPEAAIVAGHRAMQLSPRDPEMMHFHVGVGTAHFVAGRYEEAEECAKLTIVERPDIPSGHRLLAASLAHQNRLPEAEKALWGLLKIRPDMTAHIVRNTIHFKYPEHLESFIDGLVKAGLPTGVTSKSV